MVEKTQCRGSYNDLDVPPTLVSFCIGVVDTNKVVSNEFKSTNSKVYILKTKIDENFLPDFDNLKENYDLIHELIKDNNVLSVATVRQFGIADTITKMCIGNKIGFRFKVNKCLFKPRYASFIIESEEELNNEKLEFIGNTIEEAKIILPEKEEFNIVELIKIWAEPLEKVFPTKCNKTENRKIGNVLY